MSDKPSVYMMTQNVGVGRRAILQAHTLTEAGYDVTILACSTPEATRALNLPAGPEAEFVEGIPIQRIKAHGQDPRYRWLYRLGRLAGQRSQRKLMLGVAVLGALHGRNAFSYLAPRYAAQAQADIYTAHDLDTLEAIMLAALQNNAKVIYDAHELFSEVPHPLVRVKKRYWDRLEQRLIPKCDAVSTVNEFIAEEMVRRYHIPAPTVIYNATNPPPNFDPTRRYNHLRSDLGISVERRIALYQGGIILGRGLEELVLAGRFLPDDVVIVIMGMGSAMVRRQLDKLISERRLQNKVYLHDPVPESILLEYCASADVGVIHYPPSGLNIYYVSPNKLFDYIQAHLPIVANDLPFLRKVVGGEGLGLVSALDTPESYAKVITTLLNDQTRLAEARTNLQRAAQIYNWTNEGKKLVAMYEQVRQQAGP